MEYGRTYGQWEESCGWELKSEFSLSVHQYSASIVSLFSAAFWGLLQLSGASPGLAQWWQLLRGSGLSGTSVVL